jgi:hypothetical protein
MKYDFASQRESSDALMQLTQLISEKKKVEIKVIKPRRSLPQNSYLHLLLGYLGSHRGWTMDETKGLYKRLPGNKDIYIKKFEHDGAKFEFERSSAALDKDEMTKTIEVLREWSAEHGFPLPTATDQDWLRRLENDVERNEKYL